MGGYAPKTKQANGNEGLAKMPLAALGIVFGDIATSPIDAIRECFHDEYGIASLQPTQPGFLFQDKAALTGSILSSIPFPVLVAC